MLYNIIVLPIEMIVEWVFNTITQLPQDLPIMIAIVGVSIVINMLALPLYNIADKIQDIEREKVLSMSYWVNHIKKTFKGDEKFMMLSQYYKQNNYHPLYALRSSLSILIEIPFFIAAYHFLSHAEALKGSSWWIFKDLGSPDALFQIGTFTINTLPLLMTLINLVSGFVYTKEFPLKDKIQLYGIGLLFLVLLYNSPSGLVLYWICNNLFSLVKNIVNKLKRPSIFWHRLITGMLLVVALYFLKYKTESSIQKRLIFMVMAIGVGFIPTIYKVLVHYLKNIKFPEEKALFVFTLLTSLALALFVGLLLSSKAIASSPVEFSFLGDTSNPISYVKYSAFFFLGLFCVWPLIIYKMFNYKVKVSVSFILFIMLIGTIVNALILKSNYGDLDILFTVNSSNLNNYSITFVYAIIGVFIFSLILYFIITRQSVLKFFNISLLSLILGTCLFSFTKITTINNDFKKYRLSGNFSSSTDIKPEYHLTKNGKNVVILFLDRAIGAFIPEIFDNYPEIKEQFKEFTYYDNTVSFSNFTVTGAPAIYGGYEYNQKSINERKNEKLKDKHNEALLVLPCIFNDGGYEVTVLDPPWPSYSGNLSFYKNHSINAKDIEGKYYLKYAMEKGIEEYKGIDKLVNKELINFSILQILPFAVRVTFNNNCRCSLDKQSESGWFFKSLSNLYYFKDMTAFDSYINTLTIIHNGTTHNVCFPLTEDFEHRSNENLGLSEVEIDYHTGLHMQANIAAYKQIGKWLDYLKDNDCFDNTRIILVSDHGRDINPSTFNLFEDSTIPAYYNALLMVKDFNQKEGGTNNTFMTNADTLFIAKEGLNLSDTNPFTGKIFTQDKEGGIDVYACLDWNANHFREAYKYDLDINQAYHVQGDIHNPLNWTPLNNKNSHLAMNVGD